MLRLRSAALIVAGVLAVGCSSDSDDDASTTTATGDASTSEPGDTATTPNNSPGGSADEPGAPTTGDVDDLTAPSTSAAPSGSEPDDGDADADTELDAGDAVAELDAGLPGARALGLDRNRWHRVVHTAEQDDIPADEIDPFEGLLECPDRFALPAQDGPWVERRFRTPEPVDDLLTVRVIAIGQDDEANERWIGQLGRCQPLSPEVFLEHGDRTIDVDDTTFDTTTIDLVAPATEGVPFPAQAAYMTTHVDGVTLAVSVFGQSTELGFLDQAEELLQVTLDRAT